MLVKEFAGGMMENDSIEQFLVRSYLVSSGRASREAVCMRISSSSQPTKRAVPQLVPDGLSPDAHVVRALECVHPFH